MFPTLMSQKSLIEQFKLVVLNIIMLLVESDNEISIEGRFY